MNRPIPSPTTPLVTGDVRMRHNVIEPDPVVESVRGDAPVAEATRNVVAGDRVRQHKGQMNIDPFHIPDEIWPGGWETFVVDGKAQRLHRLDLNWKNVVVQGMVFHNQIAHDEEQGWRPVPHSWFPGRYAAMGTEGNIVVQDMALMERPMSLTLEAKSEEKIRARRAVDANARGMGETPDGQAPRMVITNRDSRMDIAIPD